MWYFDNILLKNRRKRLRSVTCYSVVNYDVLLNKNNKSKISVTDTLILLILLFDNICLYSWQSVNWAAKIQIQIRFI